VGLAFDANGKHLCAGYVGLVNAKELQGRESKGDKTEQSVFRTWLLNPTSLQEEYRHPDVTWLLEPVVMDGGFVALRGEGRTPTIELWDINPLKRRLSVATGTWHFVSRRGVLVCLTGSTKIIGWDLSVPAAPRVIWEDDWRVLPAHPFE